MIPGSELIFPPIVVLIGLSRIFLGLHYLTDVCSAPASASRPAAFRNPSSDFHFYPPPLFYPRANPEKSILGHLNQFVSRGKLFRSWE